MNPLNRTEWSVLSRLAFKFIFIYLLLYCLPFQFLYQGLLPWFGELFFGIEEEFRTDMTGSGDMLYHWLTFAFDLTVAFLGMLIWTAIDRNSKSYHRMAEGLWILARYYLAVVLLGYGLSKVFPMQFPEPGLIRLTQEYGDSSPMGLAWTFMGFSTGYQVFAGIMEVIPALLLFFRRTVLIGALIAAAVMTNVFLINMFFDVPVKLFSAHLLLIAVGLAALHAKPLWNFFITGESAQQVKRPFPIQDDDWRKISYVVKAVFITLLIGAQLFFIGNQYRSLPEAPEVAGIYEVVEFELDNNEVAPLTSDKIRWNRIVIDNVNPGRIAIDYMTGDRVRFSAELNAETNSISGRIPPNPQREDSRSKEFFAEWEKTAENEYTLTGELGDKPLFLKLKKQDHEELLLISRGFHWINEFPFNR